MTEERIIALENNYRRLQRKCKSMYPFHTIYIKPMVRSNASFLSILADNCDGHDYAAKSAYKEYEIEQYINSVVQAMENLRGTIGIVEKAKQEASITSDIIRYAGAAAGTTGAITEANFYHSFTDKVEEQLKNIKDKIGDRFLMNNAVEDIIREVTIQTNKKQNQFDNEFTNDMTDLKNAYRLYINAKRSIR